jgi:hypothetical protein
MSVNGNFDPEFPDLMVDLETTDPRSAQGAILQIASVKFNLNERTVCLETFDRCMTMPSTRRWEESTRHFWGKQDPTILQDIIRRGEDPRVVMLEYAQWTGHYKHRLWGKPSHFEYPHLDSYFNEFGVINPFFYRHVENLHSFLRGKCHPEPVPDIKTASVGKAHNALNDCFFQIKHLFEIMDIVEGKGKA